MTEDEKQILYTEELDDLVPEEKEKPKILKRSKQDKSDRPNNCANCAGSKFC